MRMALAAMILVFGPVGWAVGQSSSLFKRDQAKKAAELAASTQPSANGAMAVNAGAESGNTAKVNPKLAAVSLTAITVPEPKVIKVHDLVGIIIRYEMRHQSSAKLKQDSEWDLNAKLDAWFRLHDRKWTEQGFRSGKPEVKFKNENQMENEGKSDRNDVLETRVMAKVLDVKPNGNLILVAWQKKEFTKDVQYLRVSGECSVDHITPDGNVTSDKLFGLNVKIMNEGEVQDAVKRGWFKELLDGWKPF